MNSKIFNILNFLLISLIIFIISLKWKSIGIPLNNHDEIVSILALKNYNPINDTIRYVIFISLPIISFIIFNYLFNKNNMLALSGILKKNSFDNQNLKIKEHKLLFLLLFSLIALEVITLNVSHYVLDTLHDGDYLTPAQNFFYYNQIWTASYTVHGGSNVIYPVLAWKLFNLKSIGAMKIFFIVLIAFLKISCVFLAFQLTKVSTLNKNGKIILFVSLSILLLGMSYYQLPLNYSLISYRDLYVILFLIFLIEAIISNKNQTILNFFISFLPIIAIIMHLDSGVYLYFVYFMYLIFLLINNEYKKIILNISFTLIFWIIFFFTIGKAEFYSFCFHFINMLKNVDLLHGTEFPNPFLDIFNDKQTHASRATKSLILQLMAGILICNAVINKNQNYSYNQKIVFIFIFCLSFIMYKNALGRSDSYHIRMSTDFPILIVCFFFINLMLRILDNKISNFINNKKITSTIIFFLLSIYALENIKFKNLFISKSNFKNLLLTKDDVYINSKTQNFIDFLKIEFKNEKCIYNFTEDLSLAYLLKKPSCNKYFAPWLTSGKKLEEDYVKNLKETKPNYIIYKSSQFRVDIDTVERLKNINKYILENYTPYFDNYGYEIYKIKKL